MSETKIIKSYDLHMHTGDSFDTNLSSQESMDLLAKKNGLRNPQISTRTPIYKDGKIVGYDTTYEKVQNVVAFTEHDTNINASKKKNSNLIRGAEITTNLLPLKHNNQSIFKSAHILFYPFLNSESQRKWERDENMEVLSCLTRDYFYKNKQSNVMRDASLGTKILAFRNLISKEWGCTIPLTKFIPLVRSELSEQDFRKKALNIAYKYLDNNPYFYKNNYGDYKYKDKNVLYEQFKKDLVAKYAEAEKSISENGFSKVTIYDLYKIKNYVKGALCVAHPWSSFELKDNVNIPADLFKDFDWESLFKIKFLDKDGNQIIERYDASGNPIYKQDFISQDYKEIKRILDRNGFIKSSVLSELDRRYGFAKMHMLKKMLKENNILYDDEYLSMELNKKFFYKLQRLDGMLDWCHNEKILLSYGSDTHFNKNHRDADIINDGGYPEKYKKLVQDNVFVETEKYEWRDEFKEEIVNAFSKYASGEDLKRIMRASFVKEMKQVNSDVAKKYGEEEGCTSFKNPMAMKEALKLRKLVYDKYYNRVPVKVVSHHINNNVDELPEDYKDLRLFEDRTMKLYQNPIGENVYGYVPMVTGLGIIEYLKGKIKANIDDQDFTELEIRYTRSNDDIEDLK